MNQIELETMRRLQNNKSEIKTLKIKVDPQMYFEVEEYKRENNIKTFEAAMFALFELGREAYREQRDERGE